MARQKSFSQGPWQSPLNLTSSALSCLMLVAVTTVTVSVLAQAGTPSLRATYSCPSGSSALKTAKVNGYVDQPQLVHSSLHRAEATMFQYAQKIIDDPQLFSFEVRFDKGFLEREPSDTGLMPRLIMQVRVIRR